MSIAGLDYSQPRSKTDRIGRTRSVCVGPLDMPLGGNTEASERTRESIGPHDMRILTRESPREFVGDEAGRGRRGNGGAGSNAMKGYHLADV
jgi:hypothetical protein